MTNLSETEIQEIEKRCEAAIDAPWEAHETRVYFPNCWGGFDLRDGPKGAEANAAFIAHARQDIPTLLSTVRELQRQVQEQPKAIMALIRARYVMVPIGWSARVKNPGPDTNLEFDGLPDQDEIQDETLAFITKDKTP